VEAGEWRSSRAGLPGRKQTGGGVRLFDYPGGRNVKLERLSLTHAPQAVNLWLRVIR
jgi:hypothetical protein